MLTLRVTYLLLQMLLMVEVSNLICSQYCICCIWISIVLKLFDKKLIKYAQVRFQS